DWVEAFDDVARNQSISPKGKQYIKLSYSCEDPYTPDDLLAFVEANYDSDGEMKHEASHIVDEEGLGEFLHALQVRILELETVNASQDIEISQLRDALQKTRTEYGHRVPNVASPGSSRTASADTFGVTSPRNTQPRDVRPVSRADSVMSSTWSSVSSVTSSSAGPSTPRRGARPLTVSPSLTSQHAVRPPWFIFGPSSDRALKRHDLGSMTHNVLQDIADQFPQEEWPRRLSQQIPACSADVVRSLVKAMTKDTNAAIAAANATV
ncbi:hypothetical protein K466DRAFT_570696, partial [Polyporus arcularius HHB13444]